MTDIQKRLQNMWLRGYRYAISGGQIRASHWSAYNHGLEAGRLDLAAATTAAQLHAMNATAEETS